MLKTASDIKAMFARIAPAYDLNNRLHSLGRDIAWRRALVAAADVQPGQAVLDVACGTGDVAGLLAASNVAGRIVGLDFCPEMIAIAQRKFAGATIEWVVGDATALPLADASFDVVTIAFGLRNIPDMPKALAEFRRVLRPGGRLAVLEFHPPKKWAMAGLLGLYLWKIMPRTAGWIARDRTGAYRYLCTSIHGFLTAEQMSQEISKAGFVESHCRPLNFAMAAIHIAEVAGEKYVSSRR